MKTCNKCKTDQPIQEFTSKGSHANYCRTCNRAYAAAYRARNKEKIAANRSAFHARNPDADATYSREYKLRHPDKVRAARAIYRRVHKETAVAAVKSWHNRNKDRRVASRAKRRATELMATPTWANQDRIVGFYSSAKGLEMLLGEFYHVDHIVPLQGDTVCGLHNEFNLRVIPAKENLSKGNRFWPDMP